MSNRPIILTFGQDGGGIPPVTPTTVAGLSQGLEQLGQATLQAFDVQERTVRLTFAGPPGRGSLAVYLSAALAAIPAVGGSIVETLDAVPEAISTANDLMEFLFDGDRGLLVIWKKRRAREPVESSADQDKALENKRVRDALERLVSLAEEAGVDEVAIDVGGGKVLIYPPVRAEISPLLLRWFAYNSDSSPLNGIISAHSLVSASLHGKPIKAFVSRIPDPEGRHDARDVMVLWLSAKEPPRPGQEAQVRGRWASLGDLSNLDLPADFPGQDVDRDTVHGIFVAESAVLWD